MICACSWHSRFLEGSMLKALYFQRENAVEGSDDVDYSAKGEPAMQKIEDS